MRRYRWSILTFFLISCTQEVGGEPAEDDDPSDLAGNGPAITFRKDIAPMFVGKCTLCHHPDNATGIDLTQPFDPEVGIVGRETNWKTKRKLIVDPGKPSNSFLLQKVSLEPLDADTQGAPMPLLLPILTAPEVVTIRTWISEGANDDDFYRDNVAQIFGDGVSLGSDGGKCSYCHYSESSLPDLTDPFSDDGVVGVQNSRGQLLVAPGDPDNSLVVQKVEARVNAGLPMPLWLESLTSHEVALIERWIRDGAKDE